MAPYRRWLDPLLTDAFRQAEQDNDRRKQLHARLALLPVDASHVEWLYHQLLDADAQEVPLIRDFLTAHQSDLVNRLWVVAEKPEKGKEQQRLRAAATLAGYDPESQLWGHVCEPVANDLVSVPAVYLATWMELFRPVRMKLLPPLAVVFRDGKRRETERSLAADLLADYAADQPQVLADLLMDADEKQFAVLYPKLQVHGDRALAVLHVEVDKKLPPDLPSSDEKREKLAKRQANAAAALLRMNHPVKVWPLLKHSSDPRARSYLILRLSPLGADAGAISKHLDVEPDVTIRRALLLSLGEYGEKELLSDTGKTLLPNVQDLYRTDGDPGLHAAAEWLLGRWQQETWLKQTNEEWAKDKEQRQKPLESIQQLLTKDKEKNPSRWYVNGQGQTMVVIPGPVEFMMGSPPTEAGRQPHELQHKRRISRSFALAAKAVTVEQYRKFAAGYDAGASAPTGDCPVIGTNWFQAVAYCNWLSQQEGLPESEWCYEPLQDPKALPALASSSVGLLVGSLGPLPATCGLFPGRTDSEYKGGMKLAQHYLQRTGYRLPTEAEMEYATRAGAVTSRFFGETEELLPRYAWYAKNSRERAWPVGSLKPNDLGLFDMHGNVYTWCQEDYPDYLQERWQKDNEDIEYGLTINVQDRRPLRCGSFLHHAQYVRSAARRGLVPATRDGIVGFRAARTLTTERAP
jgi:formylglycine-generating enzyme required for sulfatase activity